MKKICIFSIFAFFAVSIGMHAQTQKTLFFGDPNDPDESYSGYTINLSGSGVLESFLSSASPEVKSAEYIEITGATLNEDDVAALAKGEDPTGIVAVHTGSAPVAVYTLDGRKVCDDLSKFQALRPGVYIIGGKKLVVRR